MMLHLNKSAVPIGERARDQGHGDAPAWLEDLVMACIEKDPSKRPASMDVVARTLATVDTPGAALSSSRISVRIAASGPSSEKTASDSPTITESIASLPPRSHPPDSTPAPRARASPAMIAAAFVAALLVFVAIRVTEKAPTTPAIQMQNAPIASPPPAAPIAAKRAFQLEIESTPSGADVRDGDALLGTTPLTLSVDNEDARKAPRKLTLAKGGYQPYSIVQGPSDDNVRVLATLVTAPPPAPTAPPAPAPASTGKAASAPNAPNTPSSAKPAANTTKATKEKLDIRLTR